MAGMATTLTTFSEQGNKRTSAVTGNTVSLPKLVLQSRSVPTAPNGVGEHSARVLYGAKDANDSVLPGRISFQIIGRIPVGAAATEVDAAIALARDIVQSDDWANSVKTLEYL